MDDDDLVRVTFEYRDNAEWRLFVSDLAAVRRRLGPDVLEAFCRCYVHADRLVGLITMFLDAMDARGTESVRSRRCLMAFYPFAVGTLRELGYALDYLAGALRRRGILDVEAWKNGLRKWQIWSESATSTGVRDQISFHLDSRIVHAGVESISNRLAGAKVCLYEGDKPDLPDSWFRLAHVALLEGAHLQYGDLETLMTEPAKLMIVHDDLDKAFRSALVTVGLDPMKIRVRSADPLPPIAEPLPENPSNRY